MEWGKVDEVQLVPALQRHTWWIQVTTKPEQEQQNPVISSGSSPLLSHGHCQPLLAGPRRPLEL